MTKPKSRADLTRFNRRLGEVLRELVGCPLCRKSPVYTANTLLVVAYRSRAVRFECPHCGLRFSIDITDDEHAFSASAARSPGVDYFASYSADEIWNRGEPKT